MPSGKPFVCWIGSPGKYHDVALHIGDDVEVKTDTGEWVVGKFGCCRKKKIFPYFVRCGKIRHYAGTAYRLRPVQKGAQDGNQV